MQFLLRYRNKFFLGLFRAVTQAERLGVLCLSIVLLLTAFKQCDCALSGQPETNERNELHFARSTVELIARSGADFYSCLM